MITVTYSVPNRWTSSSSH